MDRKTLCALVALAAAVACSGYLIDKDPSHLHDGDGGLLDIDGALPHGDGGFSAGSDGGVWQPPDTGFGKPCNTEVRQVELSPLDLLVVLDVSYSMDYDQKWSSVKSALTSFVSNPDFAGLGVGLQYFPLRAQCTVDAYQAPAVQIGVLGGPPDQDVGPVIAGSLAQQQMAGGTPTTQVLEGTTAYVKSWLARPANANHKAVVVLATDGMPDGTCAAVTSGLPNSLANALTVASQAAAGNPPVKLFVIGVGKDLAPLDQLAAAGGTGSAILVDTTANADLAFFDALMNIRRSALGCVFTVPPNQTGQQGEIDPKNAQVVFSPDDGSPETFVNVGNYSGCGGAGGLGWYFDDPDDPTELILCDDACTEVTQGQTGKLNVEFACKWTPT